MARTRLLDAWHRSRRERTRMPWGRRVASMEAQLGADMTPGRHARWERLDLDQPEHDTEHQVDEHQVDEHQAAPDQYETEHETEQEHEEEAAAGPDESGGRGEQDQAPHPGVQAREFEEQLFSGTFGGAAGQHQQVGDAANEIDYQQHREATEPEPESEPELEDDEVEP